MIASTSLKRDAASDPKEILRPQQIYVQNICITAEKLVRAVGAAALREGMDEGFCPPFVGFHEVLVCNIVSSTAK